MSEGRKIVAATPSSAFMRIMNHKSVFQATDAVVMLAVKTAMAVIILLWFVLSIRSPAFVVGGNY